jgi:hypothetical protein
MMLRIGVVVEVILGCLERTWSVESWPSAEAQGGRMKGRYLPSTEDTHIHFAVRRSTGRKRKRAGPRRSGRRTADTAPQGMSPETLPAVVVVVCNRAAVAYRYCRRYALGLTGYSQQILNAPPSAVSKAYRSLSAQMQKAMDVVHCQTQEVLI